MSTPPWGHKPPAVDNIETYWSDPPPVPSERCEYWLRRYREGSWRPNKHLAVQGYDGTACWLGVYIWEAINVFYPLIAEDRRQRGGAFSPARGSGVCGTNVGTNASGRTPE